MTKTDYCAKCPYKLGLIKTLVNPCPQCKKSKYSLFKQLGKNPTNPLGEKHGTK